MQDQKTIAPVITQNARIRNHIVRLRMARYHLGKPLSARGMRQMVASEEYGCLWTYATAQRAAVAEVEHAKAALRLRQQMPDQWRALRA